MSNNLEFINKKLQNAISINFDDEIGMECYIDEVAPIYENKAPIGYSFVASNRNDTTIRCMTKIDISNYENKDLIRLTGKVIINQFSEAVIEVNSLYKVDMEEKNKKMLELYNKAKNNLTRRKYQEIISNFTQKKISVIYNIGLIVPTSDSSLIDAITDLFREKCKGNLHIYRLDMSRTRNDILIALEYFSKYHDIDAICFAHGPLTDTFIYELSTSIVVTEFLNRQIIPCFFSYVPENTQMVPLVSETANKKFKDYVEMINYIFYLQKEYQEGLTKNINLVKNNIIKKITDYRNELNSMKIMFEGISVTQKDKETRGNKLKRLMKQRIENEIKFLEKISNKLMKTVLNDEKIKNILINQSFA